MMTHLPTAEASIHPTPEEIRRTVAETLGVPEETLTDAIGVGDIPEWDSLAQLSILTSLEEQYNLHIPEERMMESLTLGDLVRYATNGVAAPAALPSAAPQETAQPTPREQHVAAPPIPRYDHRPVVQTILLRAEEHPAKSALVFGHTTLTYRQLAEGIRGAAQSLAQQGVRRGDVVAMYAAKTESFFCFYFGAHLLGAAVLNLDPAIRAERRDYIFAQVRPVLTLAADAQLTPQADAPALSTAPDMQDTAEIMFSTGTTGEPKGVLLSHANIAASVYHINSFIGTGADDVEALALPVCHSFGIGRVRCVLAVGGTVVMAPGFSNPMHLYSLLRAYRITGLALTPAAWAYMKRVSGMLLAEYARELRYMEIGSAPMAEAERRELMRLFPHTRICIYYGLTEASRSTFMECQAESSKLCSVGRASPGVEVRICSESGETLPPGCEGEVCIRGAHVMKGYLRGNEAAFHGSYLRSGDWGSMDAEGYVTISGRIRDIINVGGKKVCPEEVESVLNSLPGIAESACVPMPDPQGILGEVVKALLVPDDSAERPTDAWVTAQVAARLERYKVPVCISWVDHLERTQSGKISRRLMS